MDVVGAVLDAHRGRGAFVLDCAMAPPWGLRVADRAAVAVLAVVSGSVALVEADGAETLLEPGDVAVIAHAQPYVIGDDAATRPSAVIEPGQVCRPLAGQVTFAPDGAGRTWGNDPRGADRFVVGVYELPGQLSGRLFADLPGLVVARSAGSGVVDLLQAEVAGDEPAREVVLDRLVDLVLITTLRGWLAQAGPDAPGWWRAQGDPSLAVVLEAMHAHPETAWTLTGLADRAAVSRATLARRFAEVVGEPPMRYLARWRLAQAADLLAGTTLAVEQVARRVGYANAFAFSTAFRREYGQAPRPFRTEFRSQLA